MAESIIASGASSESFDLVQGEADQKRACIDGSLTPENVPLSVQSRGATLGPFMVERVDQDNGVIVYEIWSAKRDLVLGMADDFNPKAKADAELICHLLNNQHPE